MLSLSGSGTKGWNLKEKEGEGSGGVMVGREGVMQRKVRRGRWLEVVMCCSVVPRPVSPVCGAQVEPDGELEGRDEGNVDQEL